MYKSPKGTEDLHLKEMGRMEYFILPIEPLLDPASQSRLQQELCNG